jgi:hypothetical protein
MAGTMEWSGLKWWGSERKCECSNATKRMPVDSGTCILPVSHVYMRLVLIQTRQVSVQFLDTEPRIARKVSGYPAGSGRSQEKTTYGGTSFCLSWRLPRGVSSLRISPASRIIIKTVLLIRRKIPHRRSCAPSLRRLGHT